MKTIKYVLALLTILFAFNTFAMEEGIVRSGQKRSADTASDGQESKRQRAESTDSAEQEPAEQTVTQEHELPLIEQMLPNEILAHIANYVMHDNPNVPFVLNKIQGESTTISNPNVRGNFGHAAFYPDGKTIIATPSRGAKSIVIWKKVEEQADTYQTEKKSIQSTGNANALAINNNATYLALCKYGTIEIMDGKTHKHIKTIENKKRLCVDIAFSRQNPNILLCAYDPTVSEPNATIEYWDVTNGSCIEKKTIKQSPVGLTLSSDGTKLAAFNGGKAKVYDLENLESNQAIEVTTVNNIKSQLALSSNGTYCAVYNYTSKDVYIRNVKDNKACNIVIRGKAPFSPPAFSTDESFLAIIDWDHTIKIYHTKDGSLYHTIQMSAILKENGNNQLMKTPIGQMVFSPDDTCLALLEKGRGVIHMYNIPPLKEMNRYLRNGLTVRNAALFESIVQAIEKNEKFELSDDGEKTFDSLEKGVKDNLEQWVTRPKELREALEKMRQSNQLQLIQNINAIKNGGSKYPLGKDEEDIFNTLSIPQQQALKDHVLRSAEWQTLYIKNSTK